MSVLKRIMDKFRISEISGVTVPAQEDARATIMKKAAGAPAVTDEDADTLSDDAPDNTQEPWACFGNAVAALSQSIQSILSDVSIADKGSMIEESLSQFAEHVAQIASDDDSGAGAVDDAESDDDAGTDADAADNDDDDDNDEDGGDAAAKSSIIKMKDGTIIRRAAVGEKLWRVLKAQDDTMRSQARDLARGESEKQSAAFAKRAADLGFPESFGATLHKAYRGEAVAVKTLESEIRALRKQIDTGQLFAQIGSRAGAGAVAYDELSAKADGLRKANPKLSKAQAFAKIYEDPTNRDLVARHKQEAAGAAN